MSGDTLLPLAICPKELIEEGTKYLGKFYRISGNKHFCVYVLVYDKCHIKAASDLSYDLHGLLFQQLFSQKIEPHMYNHPMQLTLLSSMCVVPEEGLKQLE